MNSQTASEPSSAPITSGHGDRGLRKKWLKKLREGKVKASDIPAGLLAPTDIASAVDSVAFGLRITGAKQLEQGLTNSDLQMLALSCLEQAALDHRWFDIQGKGGLTCFVLLFAKGVTWDDWQEQSQQNVPLPFLRAAQPQRLLHRRGRWWNASVRVVEPMESDILYLQRNAVVLDDPPSAQHDKSAAHSKGTHRERKEGRSVQQWKGAEEEEGDEEEDDEEEGVEPDILTRRVYSLSLSYEELASHGYPLADHTQKTAEATPQWEDDPPGCIAGLPQHLSAACTLCIPKGYMLTRTAHADLHALVDSQAGSSGSPASCPVFEHITYKQGPEPDVDGGASADEENELEPPRFLALDCEMCLTDRGFQLARVSCVDDAETLAVDEYVKPLRPIKDYLTRYSGITPKLLAQKAEYTFHEVREQVADALDGVDELARLPETQLSKGTGEGVEASLASTKAASDGKRRASPPAAITPTVYIEPAVACGHSLENDLRALKLIHTRVVDTSLCRPFLHPQGLPSRMSLRHLSKQHLDRAIQTGHGRSDGGGGHDSAEDALAVLHLIHTILFQPTSKKEQEGGVEDDVPSLKPAEVPTSKAAAGPPSKRRKTEGDADSEGDDSSRPPVPPYPQYLARPLREALRLRPIPEKTEETSGGSSAVSAGSGGRTGGGAGVASTLAGLAGTSASKDGQEEVASRRTGFHAPPQAWGTDKRRSILALPDMSKPSVVCDVTLVGSAPFVNAHLCGSAGAVQVHVRYDAATVVDMRRVTDRVLTEAKRISALRAKAAETARSQGHASDSCAGERGPGFVIAELLVPHQGAEGGSSAGSAPAAADHHKPDMKTFDQVLAGLCNHLPRGCLVMLATQAGQLRFTARKKGAESHQGDQEDPLAAAQSAKSGVVFFHTT